MPVQHARRKRITLAIPVGIVALALLISITLAGAYLLNKQDAPARQAGALAHSVVLPPCPKPDKPRPVGVIIPQPKGEIITKVVR